MNSEQEKVKDITFVTTYADERLKLFDKLNDFIFLVQYRDNKRRYGENNDDFSRYVYILSKYKYLISRFVDTCEAIALVINKIETNTIDIVDYSLIELYLDEIYLSIQLSLAVDPINDKYELRKIFNDINEYMKSVVH